MAPVPEVIDSWQELHPAPSPLPPAPPVVASATPRTFPEPSSLSGVYAPKVARGWTPSRPSQKPVTSVPGKLCTLNLNNVNHININALNFHCS